MKPEKSPISLLRPEIAHLEPSGIARVALPRVGDPEVIPLWFGEGDAVTDELIRDAAKKALDDGQTFYTHTRGRPELRRAIKTYLDGLYGVDIHPDRISVPGASMMGVTLAAQMSVGHGRHALIASPNWPNIERSFLATGARVSFVRQREENGRWSLHVSDIAAAIRDDTKAIFVNSPCNPTGWIMQSEEQRRLLDLCRERDIVLISDEVYHRTVFDADVAPSLITIANDDDPVIIINGFSKAWAMTGWRLGWMVAPAAYAEKIAILSECFNTGAPSFVQVAGTAALQQGEAVVESLRRQYAEGRQIVMDILGEDPRIELLEPEGAFYAFPRVPGLQSSLVFCQGLLAERDVGTSPGYTFGPGNEEHFRICFAQSHERLAEGLRRIRAHLDHHWNELVAKTPRGEVSTGR